MLEPIGADYERLRALALQSPLYAQGRWGMALFVNRGFAAWLQACEQVLPARTRSVSSGEPVVLPSSVQGSMVMALAGMVLIYTREMLPDNRVRDRNKFARLTFCAFYFWLVADPEPPLVHACWLVSATPVLAAFKAKRKDIFPSGEEFLEQTDLRRFQRMCIDGVSTL